MAQVSLSQGIRLLDGSLFDFWNPEAWEPNLEVIARGLANVCRFGGQVWPHLSVAQHAVNVSRIVPAGFELEGLMHDTAEAFTGDLPTPLKHAVPAFKEIEQRIEGHIARHYGLPFPMSPEVKLADSQMLALEKKYRKRDSSTWETLDGVEFEHLLPLVRLEPMSPEKAYRVFMARWEELR